MFIRWLSSNFGSSWFTSSDVVTILNLDRQHIYADLHKCWKMGLLSRENMRGHKYKYQISNWGMRYAKKGVFHSQDGVYMKLLKYITEYGDQSDKNWAEEIIVPRLMQRFIRGKKKQDIIPYIDIIDAESRSIRVRYNKLRYRYVTHARHFDSKQEGVEELDELQDKFALKLIKKLLSQLHPEI